MAPARSASAKPAPAPAASQGFALSGHVAAIPLHEVIGMLVIGKKTGVLKVAPAGTLRGEGLIQLAGGCLVAAQFAQLPGAEAVMEMLSLPDAAFSFATADVEKATPLEWMSILMERARLEDEFERNHAYYPGDQTRLLRSDKPAPADLRAINAAVPEVIATIDLKPRITAEQLMATQPFCSLRIRLAVAWLVSQGALGEYNTQGIPVAMRGLGDQWFQKLLFVGRGGVRILLASPPEDGPEELNRQIANVAKDVGAVAPEVGLPQDGPAIARLRPKTGGLISFTILPVHKRHRAMFESLLPGTQIAVIPALDAAGESQVWRYLVPERIPALTWHPETHDEQSLLKALRQHGLSLPT